MRILLSAFACCPHHGSDKEVGWGWAINLARRNHDVTVITRRADQQVIEAELKLLSLPNLRFVYHDSERAFRILRKLTPRAHAYYYLWQWGAYQIARSLHTQKPFDLVHHVTWVSIRQPSFMGNLRIPFLLGPVAGGDTTPYRLRFGYGLRQWLNDGLRDITNLLPRLDPLVHRTCRQAEHIYATSPATLMLVPKAYRHKCRVRLAISAQTCDRPPPSGEPVTSESAALKLLYVGRFLDLKGMFLGLPAFAKHLAHHPETTLTLVGQGPDEKRWRALANRLGINARIRWIPWLPQDKLHDIYREHDVFLYPSLRDSGGLVVLEALGAGLPVICLDLGGPGVIVNSSCGRVVPARKSTRPAVIDAIAAALSELASNPQLRHDLSVNARHRPEQFTWSQLVDDLYANMTLPSAVEQQRLTPGPIEQMNRK